MTCPVENCKEMSKAQNDIGTLFDRTRGVVTLKGLATSLSILLVCVGLLMTVFMQISSSAAESERINQDLKIQAVDKTANEAKADASSTKEDINQINLTLSQMAIIIENQNKTLEKINKKLE